MTNFVDISTHPAIAIVGMSAIFPGSVQPRGFWQNILHKKDLLTDVPPTHWRTEDYYDADPKTPDKTYGKRGGFLPDVPFEPLAFGIPPNQLESTDSGQLLALLVAKQVLEDAFRGQFANASKERISVVIGTTGATELILEMASRLERPKWYSALRAEGVDDTTANRICDRIAAQYAEWKESTFPGLLPNVVAGRIAHKLDLGGMNCITDAACASSLAALQIALNELHLHHSDVVITGGVDALNTISMFMCFSKTPALSLTGDCRPFDADADGTMLGEGLGMVALKRLADAERDGDQIYAVIRGLGASSDGKSSSVYAPVSEGQARSIRNAYDNAGYAPNTVELVEAHGTATKVGDVTELAGLKSIFTRAGNTEPWCALGSIKGNIGHTKAAAGIAGLLKVTLALQHKILPPTIKVTAPNPKLDLENSAFYLNTEARPWIRGASHPRRAAVSSFGFGGSNFHVTLEEYTGHTRPRLRQFKSELFLFSALTKAALQTECQQINCTDEQTFRFLAQSGQQTFQAEAQHRLAIVATDAEDLRRKLQQAAQQLAQSDAAFRVPTGIYYGHGRPQGKLAFLFPGQGSQYVNMSADLAMAFDAARATWDEVADLPMGDAALHQVVFPPPVFSAEQRTAQEEKLKATNWAQPAIANASVAQLRLLQALGLQPDGYAGHSLGELTALYAAGVLDHVTLLAVTRRRGELMKEASATPGAMLAVKASKALVENCLQEWKLDVTIANYNAPEQVILAGTNEEISATQTRFAEEKISCALLPVATAFHSRLVAPAVPSFRQFLHEVTLQSVATPVYSNLDGSPYPSDSDTIRAQLSEQIACPVNFVAQIEQMYADGFRVFVEVGPQSVLTGLTDAILQGREHVALSLDRKGQDGVTQLWHALAQLACEGFALNLTSLLSGYEMIEAPTIKEEKGLTVYLNGANYRSPSRGQTVAANGHKAMTPVNQNGNNHFRTESQRDGQILAQDVSPGLATTKAPSPVKATEISHQGSQNHTSSSSLNPASNPISSVSPMPVKTAQTNGYVNGHHPSPSADWLTVFQQAQQQTLDAHTQFQRLMTESHVSFLKAAEASLLSLTQIATGATPAMPAPVAAAPVAPMPLAPPPPLSMPVVVSSTPEPLAAPLLVLSTQLDVDAMLLQIVAEKTGYPVEMLNLDMELDSDLGIDSIKRVEIFASLMDQAPALEKLDATELSKRSSLQQIVEYVRTQLGDVTTTAPAPQSPVSSELDIEASLLQIVADKTGYPVEMLNLDMELDSDLGIDSIKRVEIFAGLIDQSPKLEKLDTTELAKRSSLRQIVAYVGAQLGGEINPPKAETEVTVPVAAALDAAPIAIERFTLEWREALATGWTPSALQPGANVLITDDGTGVAAALASLLTAQKLQARVVTAREAQGVKVEDTDAVIILSGLSSLADANAALEIQRKAFQVARTFAPRFTARGGMFVTVQDTGGSFGLTHASDRAWLGGLAGLAKTAALEWPQAFVKAIDLERGARTSDELATALATELLSGGVETEIGLHADGTRGTLVSVARAMQSGKTSALPKGAVIVASGGARGVTATSLIALANEMQPRLVLLGRTPLEADPTSCAGISDEAGLKRALLSDAQTRGENCTPAMLQTRVRQVQANREIHATLHEMQRAGAEARYVAVDIREAQAVSQVLDEVRTAWGPIAGLIHGAGVIADKLIAEKTDEQFAQVFATKVEGLQTLLQVTANDPLQLIGLFSSVAGRAGNVGQCDYAMANETLNKIAALEAARRNGVCRVKSFNWGPWEGGMVTPQLKARFEALGVPLIPLSVGAQMFVDEVLHDASDNIEIVIGGKPAGSLLPAHETTPPSKKVSLQISATNYDWLQGHQIKGETVVPFTLVHEWFYRVGQSLRPDLRVTAIRELQTCKGIVLPDFERSTASLILQFTPLQTAPDTAQYKLQLSSHGTLHYHAVVVLQQDAHAADWPGPMTCQAQWPLPEIYDGEVLFHQAAFRVLCAVQGVDAAGIIGTLQSTLPDAAARRTVLLDGALQLAVLWHWQHVGGGSLPTASAAVKIYEDFDSQPVTCEVRGRDNGWQRSLSDLVLRNASGNVVAEIQGLELVTYFQKAIAMEAAQ